MAPELVTRQHADRVRCQRAGQPGTRHLGVATIGADPAKATIAMLTTGRGTNIAPLWSPDGTRLVYQHTDPQNSADLFVVAAKAGATPRVSPTRCRRRCEQVELRRA